MQDLRKLFLTCANESKILLYGVILTIKSTSKLLSCSFRISSITFINTTSKIKFETYPILLDDQSDITHLESFSWIFVKNNDIGAILFDTKLCFTYMNDVDTTESALTSIAS